jgi:GDP-L-fucose synthase
VQELLAQGALIRVPVHNRPLKVWDPRIETVSADLTRIDDCKQLMRNVRYVFHAAGGVASASVTDDYAMTSISENLLLTSRVLQAAWAMKIERFCFCSSSTCYPAVDYPVKEEEMWASEPHPSYFGYAWMRRYLERLVEYVASKSSMKIAVLRPTAIYGRFDNFDVNTCHVIPALIRRSIEKENPFVVWGTGNEIRDILHVTDLAKACLLILEKYAVCDPVNIGYGSGVRIKDIVQLVLKCCGHEQAKVIFDPSKPTTLPVRLVDVSKAKQILNFKPQVTLENGLADTVDWYLQPNLLRSDLEMAL